MRLSRFILGKCPTLSIDKARKIATKTLQDVANGTNPQADRVQQRMKVALGLDRAEMVAATWQAYIKKHVNRSLDGFAFFPMNGRWLADKKIPVRASSE